MPVQRLVAEIRHLVVLEQRGAADHGVEPAEVRHHARHQFAYRLLMREIGLENRARARDAGTFRLRPQASSRESR